MPGQEPNEPRETFFGRIIRSAREARGMTQAQMADKLGITQSAYLKIERRTKGLNEDTLERVARAHGTTVQQLVQDEIDRTAQNRPPVISEAPKAPGPEREEQLRRLIERHGGVLADVGRALGLRRQAIDQQVKTYGLETLVQDSRKARRWPTAQATQQAS